MQTWYLLIVIFVVSGLAGLIWGVIPAIFKAYFNTNETLFTLMLNYVAMQIVRSVLYSGRIRLVLIPLVLSMQQQKVDGFQQFLAMHIH